MYTNSVGIGSASVGFTRYRITKVVIGIVPPNMAKRRVQGTE